jgi:hypothetical protein
MLQRLQVGSEGLAAEEVVELNRYAVGGRFLPVVLISPRLR